MSLLLIVVILVSFANLWFYLTIGFEYIYGLDALATAVAMLPARRPGSAAPPSPACCCAGWGSRPPG